MYIYCIDGQVHVKHILLDLLVYCNKLIIFNNINRPNNMTTQIHRIHCVSVYQFQILHSFLFLKRLIEMLMVDVMIENVHTSSGKLLLASETL